MKRNTSTSAILEEYAFQYDKAGNRTSEMVNASGVKSTFNNVNQLLTQSGGGSRRFSGNLTEPSTVSVKGKAATVNADNSFEAYVDLPVGESTVPVIAKDLSGNNNVTTNKYRVNVSAGTLRTIKYDANGNTTNIVYGSTVESLKWDATDRMVEWRKIAGSTTNQLNKVYMATISKWDARCSMEDIKNSFLKFAALQLWQVRHLVYSFERLNAGATHIPHCPCSTPNSIAGHLTEDVLTRSKLEARLKMIFYELVNLCEKRFKRKLRTVLRLVKVPL